MTGIVVCASGMGTNFEAIVRASREGRLQAEVRGLITNRGKVEALARAQRLGIPARILAPKTYPTREAWDVAMLEQLQEWKADWIVLAGYLALVGPRVLATYPQHVVNSHPALLPRYGGEGMYGDRVHEAVIHAGETETGVTVHLVDEVYDRGKILAQVRVPILASDSPGSLSDRVKEAEAAFYPKVLNDLVTGRITIS